MLAIKECLIREGVLNLVDDNYNNSQNISENNSLLTNNNSINYKNHLYNLNLNNKTNCIFKLDDKYNQNSAALNMDKKYTRVPGGYEYSGDTKTTTEVNTGLEQKTAIATANISCQQSPHTKQSSEESSSNSKQKESSSALTSTKYTARKPVTRYQGIHPHFHHHTAPAYYTDLHLRIHTPNASDVGVLNENYQSVYSTASKLVEERQFPKTSTAVVAPPPITPKANSLSPTNLNFGSNSSSKNNTSARSAFFRGDPAFKERKSAEIYQKQLPTFAKSKSGVTTKSPSPLQIAPIKPEERPPIKQGDYIEQPSTKQTFTSSQTETKTQTKTETETELEKDFKQNPYSSSSLHKLHQEEENKPLETIDDSNNTILINSNPVVFACTNFKPTNTFSSNNSPFQPSGNNSNNLGSPSTTGRSRSRSKQRFVNRKKIVRVRSESRPISALYDIICKEKGLDLDTSSSNEEISSTQQSCNEEYLNDTNNNTKRYPKKHSSTDNTSSSAGAPPRIQTTPPHLSLYKSKSFSSNMSVDASINLKQQKSKASSGKIAKNSSYLRCNNQYAATDPSNALSSNNFNSNSSSALSRVNCQASLNQANVTTSHTMMVLSSSPDDDTDDEIFPKNSSHLKNTELPYSRSSSSNHQKKDNDRGVSETPPHNLSPLSSHFADAASIVAIEASQNEKSEFLNFEQMPLEETTLAYHPQNNDRPKNLLSTDNHPLNHNLSSVNNSSSSYHHHHVDNLNLTPNNLKYLEAPEHTSQSRNDLSATNCNANAIVIRENRTEDLSGHIKSGDKRRQTDSVINYNEALAPLSLPPPSTSSISTIASIPFGQLNGDENDDTHLLVGSNGNAKRYITRPLRKNRLNYQPSKGIPLDPGESSSSLSPSPPLKAFTPPPKLTLENAVVASSYLNENGCSYSNIDKTTVMTNSANSSATHLVPTSSTTTKTNKTQSPLSSPTKNTASKTNYTITNTYGADNSSNDAMVSKHSTAKQQQNLIEQQQQHSHSQSQHQQQHPLVGLPAEGRSSSLTNRRSDKKKEEELLQHQQQSHLHSHRSPSISPTTKLSTTLTTYVPHSKEKKYSTSDIRDKNRRSSYSSSDTQNQIKSKSPSRHFNCCHSESDHRNCSSSPSPTQQKRKGPILSDSSSKKLKPQLCVSAVNQNLAETQFNKSMNGIDAPSKDNNDKPFAMNGNKNKYSLNPKPILRKERCETAESNKMRVPSTTIFDETIPNQVMDSNRVQSKNINQHAIASVSDDNYFGEEDEKYLQQQRPRSSTMTNEQSAVANDTSLTDSSSTKGRSRNVIRPPELSPVRFDSSRAAVSTKSTKTHDIQRQRNEDRDKSSKRKSNLNRSLNDEAINDTDESLALRRRRRRELGMARTLLPNNDQAVLDLFVLPTESNATLVHSDDLTRNYIDNPIEFKGAEDNLGIESYEKKRAQTASPNMKSKSEMLLKAAGSSSRVNRRSDTMPLSTELRQIQNEAHGINKHTREHLDEILGVIEQVTGEKIYSEISESLPKEVSDEDFLKTSPRDTVDALEKDVEEISCYKSPAETMRQRLLKARSEEPPIDLSSSAANLKLSPILRRKSTDAGLSPPPISSHPPNQIVSILKKKDYVTGESSSASSNASPVTFSANVIDTPLKQKRTGILKKRCSLDESRSRSHSPDERSILIKSTRRNSFEELPGGNSSGGSSSGHRKQQTCGILKQSSYDSSKSEGCPSATESFPHSILKKKDSTSTPSDGNTHGHKHVSISQAVILAAAELDRQSPSAALITENRNVLEDSFTPVSNEEYEIRPILKQESTSSDDVVRPPKPILKKKSSGDSDEHEIRPILKTSRKSSREESSFDVNNDETNFVRPILKTASPSKRRSLCGGSLSGGENDLPSPSRSPNNILKRRTRSLERPDGQPIVDLAAALDAIATSQASTLPTSTLPLPNMEVASSSLKSNPTVSSIASPSMSAMPVIAAEENVPSVADRVKNIEKFIVQQSRSITPTMPSNFDETEEFASSKIFYGKPSLLKRDMNRERYKTQPITKEEKDFFKEISTPFESSFNPATSVTTIKPLSTTFNNYVSFAQLQKQRQLQQRTVLPPSTTIGTLTTSVSTKPSASQPIPGGGAIKAKQALIFNDTIHNNQSNNSNLSVSAIHDQKTLSLTGDCEGIFEMSDIEQDLSKVNISENSNESSTAQVSLQSTPTLSSTTVDTTTNQAATVSRSNSVRQRANMFQQLQEKSVASSRDESSKQQGTVSPKRSSRRLSPPPGPYTNSPSDGVRTPNNESDEEFEPSSMSLAERVRFFKNLSAANNGSSYARHSLSNMDRSRNFHNSSICSIASNTSSMSSNSRYETPRARNSLNSSSSSSVTPTPMDYSNGTTTPTTPTSLTPIATTSLVLGGNLNHFANGNMSLSSSTKDFTTKDFKTQSNGHSILVSEKLNGGFIHNHNNGDDDSDRAVDGFVISRRSFGGLGKSLSQSSIPAREEDTIFTTITNKRIKLKTIGKIMLPSTFLINDRNNNNAMADKLDKSLQEDGGNLAPKKVGRLPSAFIENFNRCSAPPQSLTSSMDFGNDEKAFEMGNDKENLHIFDNQMLTHSEKDEELIENLAINERGSSDFGKGVYKSQSSQALTNHRFPGRNKTFSESCDIKEETCQQNDKVDAVAAVPIQRTFTISELRKRFSKSISTSSIIKPLAPIQTEAIKNPSNSTSKTIEMQKSSSSSQCNVDPRFAKYFGVSSAKDHQHQQALKDEGESKPKLRKSQSYTFEKMNDSKSSCQSDCCFSSPLSRLSMNSCTSSTVNGPVTINRRYANRNIAASSNCNGNLNLVSANMRDSFDDVPKVSSPSHLQSRPASEVFSSPDVKAIVKDFKRFLSQERTVTATPFINLIDFPSKKNVPNLSNDGSSTRKAFNILRVGSRIKFERIEAFNEIVLSDLDLKHSQDLFENIRVSPQELHNNEDDFAKLWKSLNIPVAPQ